MTAPSPSPHSLRATAPTPISDLSPALALPAARTVTGVLTIAWPYSVVHHTVAFLLAHPDARCRRHRGLVRVQFEGPAARAVADMGLGGGDELLLSLDGVRWGARPATAAMPGVIEHQMIFSSRAVFVVRLSSCVWPSLLPANSIRPLLVKTAPNASSASTLPPKKLSLCHSNPPSPFRPTSTLIRAPRPPPQVRHPRPCPRPRPSYLPANSSTAPTTTFRARALPIC